MQIENCVTSIEKAFFDYLAKRLNEAEFCKRLSKILTSADLSGVSKEFEVSLIDGKADFAGMCVYPDMSQFSALITSTLAKDEPAETSYRSFCDHWFKDINKYYIEIDKNCFDRYSINLTPQELTAMLLHELSHVVFSDKTMEKFYRSYKINKAQLTRQEASVAKVAMSSFYILPGIIACGAHKMNSGPNGLREEYLCDKVFGLKDYQEHLVSAMDKIMKVYGTNAVYDDGISDKKVSANLKWCNFQVNEMEFRRDALKRDMVNMASTTHSRFTKNAILYIMNAIGLGFKDKYTGNIVATESVVEGLSNGSIPVQGFSAVYDIIDVPKETAAFETVIKCARQTYARESAFRRDPKLPKAFDIDIIDVEIDKVESHQDRIYVLDLIYARDEEISEFIEYYGEDSNQVKANRAKIDKYRKRLAELRARVLSKHTIDKGYKLWVKSPEGYEG